MNPVIEINEAVDVIASFRQVTKNKHTAIKAIPLKMLRGGREVIFTKLGLCHPVRHGSQLYYIFNVSDGANDYSLEFDTTTLGWRLISMIDGGNL
ncbi:MAG: hypothetical protein Q4C83_00845 [Candidatus Saccharibacteria bacterium]|nr:hypothetical protein [Candidatus Saccharibacteria bacterium]